MHISEACARFPFADIFAAGEQSQRLGVTLYEAAEGVSSFAASGDLLG